VAQINDETAAFDGMEVPVTVEYDDDGSFTIEVGVPPTAELIKDEAGFETGSGEPQVDFVADMSIEQVKKVAEQKSTDLLAYDVKNAPRRSAVPAPPSASPSRARTPGRSTTASTPATTTTFSTSNFRSRSQSRLFHAICFVAAEYR